MTPIEQAKLGPDAPYECPNCGEYVKREDEHTKPIDFPESERVRFTCNAVQMRTVCEKNLSGGVESCRVSHIRLGPEAHDWRHALSADRHCAHRAVKSPGWPSRSSVRPAQNSPVELTQEQKRVRIAEYFGWKGVHVTKFGVMIGVPPSTHVPPYDVLVPNYFNDLNACFEMEKVLTLEQMSQYGERLWDSCECSRNYDAPYWFLIHLTPNVRCEAFSKTLNLW